GRRVVDLEEEPEQVAVRRLLRIEDDLDRLRVPAVVAIRRVGNVAAGVADSRRHDARLPPEEILHTPEAPSGENRLFDCSAHRLPPRSTPSPPLAVWNVAVAYGSRKGSRWTPRVRLSSCHGCTVEPDAVLVAARDARSARRGTNCERRRRPLSGRRCHLPLRCDPRRRGRHP